MELFVFSAARIKYINYCLHRFWASNVHENILYYLWIFWSSV